MSVSIVSTCFTDMSQNTVNNTTAMEKIFSFIQLTGMVWNKKSVSSNVLVVFWNILVIGIVSNNLYQHLVEAASKVSIGYLGVMIAITSLSCLFHLLGSLT